MCFFVHAPPPHCPKVINNTVDEIVITLYGKYEANRVSFFLFHIKKTVILSV